MKQYVLDVAALSDRGVKRDHNEDAWAGPPSSLTPEEIAAKGRLFLVADGVGGHLAGDIASRMAVEIIPQHYYADTASDVATRLQAAIQAANDQIDREAATSPERRGMSSTVTAVVLRGDELTVANVGDSRTYLVHNGHARQLTADHTWVEEQVQVGLITREQAAKHPQRNIITRSLGSSQELEIDIFSETVEAGQSILLCSDGLSNTVSDREIGAIVARGRKAESTVKELIERAKQRGAPDNVTAVLLNIVKPAQGHIGRLLVVTAVLVGLTLTAGGLAMMRRGAGRQRETPTLVAPTEESSAPMRSYAYIAPTATMPPATATTPPATATPSPSQGTLPPPQLIQPSEDIPLMAGQPITLAWDWDDELDLQGGRFIVVVRAGEDTQPLVHEVLPLYQREFVISPSLEPGRYIWTISVSGTQGYGTSVGRLFAIVEPTPVSTGSPEPTLESP